MASLVVGGVTIPVAVGSPSWSRTDATDRGRLFDGTFFASESGGATRDWTFSTTPVTQADADTYIAALSSPVAKLCSGDIIQIPTMCSPELPSGKPTRAASSNRVVLDFMLHEIMSSKVLLRYTPGDTITGESFSRSTVGYYLNTNGQPASAAINVKRDSHYVGGIRSLLLEGASTNSMLHSSDFSNAAWVKTNITVTPGIADPMGGTAACTLTATAGAADAVQTLAAGSSIVRANSIWIRRRTGTGSVFLIDPPYIGSSPIAINASWQRFTTVGTASTIRKCGIFINTSGDAVDVWQGQQDDFAFSTSEIPTTTVAVTRGADSYSLPFTTPPQELTVYAKFVEGGTLLSSARVFEIGNAAGANPKLTLYSSGIGYNAYHHNGAASVSSGATTGPVIGDTTELLLRLFGDGSDDIVQSINAAAATTGTQSAANALPTAWAGQLVWLNSIGTAGGIGFTAIQSLKIVAGARSLSEMRAL